MKLAILSRAPHAYSTQRPRSAAEQRGHTVKVLNTLRVAIDLSGEEPDLQYRGRLLSDYDAILPRIGNSITYYGTAVVRQFEQMDVYTPNTANGITNSRDKLRATQILSRHNIWMPRTGFVNGGADVRMAFGENAPDKSGFAIEHGMRPLRDGRQRQIRRQNRTVLQRPPGPRR